MIGSIDLRATLSATMATRLRGLCTPEWTAVAALALLAEPHIAELAALDLRHVASDASQVTVGGMRDLLCLTTPVVSSLRSSSSADAKAPASTPRCLLTGPQANAAVGRP